MDLRKIILAQWICTIALLSSCDSNKNSEQEIADQPKKDTMPIRKPEGTMPADTIKGNIIIPATDPSDFGYTGTITDSVLLTFEKLVKILPEIPGYRHADTANGEGYARRTSGGIQSYVKHMYANGDKRLQIEIVDHNMSEDQYKGLLSMYERNTTVQKPEEKSKLIDGMSVSGNKAIYISYPPQNSCRLVYGVEDRFLILISGEQMQDEALLKSVALRVKANLKKVI